MKLHQSHAILLVAFSCFVLVTCRKEGLERGTHSLPFGMLKHSGCSSPKFACGGSILEFDDTAEFQATYNCLQAACEAWNDSVEALFGYLDEDAYNDTLDTLGYDEDQPLIDFEQENSFASMRQAYATAENQWIVNGCDSTSGGASGNVELADLP